MSQYNSATKLIVDAGLKANPRQKRIDSHTAPLELFGDTLIAALDYYREGPEMNTVQTVISTLRRSLGKRSLGETCISLAKIKTNPLLNQSQEGQIIERVIARKNKYLEILRDLKKGQHVDHQKVTFMLQEIRQLQWLSIFPRIKKVAFVSPLDFSIDTLRLMAYRPTFNSRIGYIFAIQGRNETEGKSDLIYNEFRSSLTHALSYLKQACVADLEISPVLFHYSLVNFLNSYNWVFYKDWENDKRNKNHGISICGPLDIDFRNWSCDFINHSNILPYMNFEKIDCPQGKFEFINSLRCLPFLKDEIQGIGVNSWVLNLFSEENDEILSSPQGLFPGRYSFSINEFCKITSFSEDEYFPELSSLIFSKRAEIGIKWKLIRPPTFQALSNAKLFPIQSIEFCPQQIAYSDFLNFYLAFRDPLGNHFAVIDNQNGISDPLFHLYFVSTFLSFVCRYYPRIWNSTLADFQARLLFEAFYKKAPTVLAWEFLRLLSGNEYEKI